MEWSDALTRVLGVGALVALGALVYAWRRDSENKGRRLAHVVAYAALLTVIALTRIGR